ncbi:hypothetical protein GGX14DRAFT_393612 [Mycena pura]|uniref:Uncharacterized protein n=1 Tax=Mycena pura TaxID=153505 RepID=A0AAD6VHB3_9AGAR|nr:hypothetical protein GGX14DRAFT_393612 [Mycena pura]
MATSKPCSFINLRVAFTLPIIAASEGSNRSRSFREYLGDAATRAGCDIYVQATLFGIGVDVPVYAPSSGGRERSKVPGPVSPVLGASTVGATGAGIGTDTTVNPRAEPVSPVVSAVGVGEGVQDTGARIRLGNGSGN